jgi:hypothetical protein
MTLSIENAQSVAAGLEAKLKPIANRKIDVADPQWIEKLQRSARALDEAGVRLEAESLMCSLLDAYASGDTSQRAGIRDLFRKYSVFVWATGVSLPPTTTEGVRLRLLRLSAMDTTTDSRDAILSVRELSEQARSHGVQVGPILREVAALSSVEMSRILEAAATIGEGQ